MYIRYLAGLSHSRGEYMQEKELIFETRNLTKHFGPTIALNNVNIKIYRGQITGLIGENGSGKSTVMSIAAGMQPQTNGEMYFMGKPHKPSSMIEGARAGIGMIVQEQGTVSGRTIAQNIFLGEEKKYTNAGFVSRSKMNRAAAEVLARIGFDEAEPSTIVDDLNLQSRKLVEIAKVSYSQPDMLVVDETTTALSQHGRDIIYGIMKKMRDENKAVVFISHDLQELIEVCDTLTVLRDGNLIATIEKDQMEENLIKRHMVGREMKGSYYRSDYGTPVNEEVVVDVEDVTSGSGLLMNFSMQVHRGEILGIGGLSHCGMHELGKVLFGEEPALMGKVTYIPNGALIDSPETAFNNGFGYVSKDRDKEALVLTASISDNIISAGVDKVSDKMGFIHPRNKRAYIEKQVSNLSIKCASINQNVQYLSGGNKQKVVFGKWVGRDCDVLILDCPTRGVDIGVKAAMYKLIYDMKLQGKTIIMISEELPELIGMCDRLIVLKDGVKAGEFLRSEELNENMVIDVMI
jgi:ribose transport system ATP-binding protein